MECTFMVGDKVTLLDGIDLKPGYCAVHGIHLLQFGAVYTIRSMFLHCALVSVQLEGIHNPKHDGAGEYGYWADWFRRVLTTDISDLEAIVRREFEKGRELLPMGVIR